MKNLFKTSRSIRKNWSIRIPILLFWASPVLPASATNHTNEFNGRMDVQAVEQQSLRTVKGIVKDVNGEPLLGVTVTVKGATHGVITSMEGGYKLDGVKPGDILVFSYIGMLPQEIAVKKQDVINVTLAEDVIGLEDVVVTGYTSMKRKDITGSVASLSTDKITRMPSYDLTSSLVGVAGIRMDGSNIQIRGVRSKNANNGPLIVLDGIPYNEVLSSINPNDIESIDILKDASSTAIYGARGANGVILVTTKQAKKGKTTVTYDGFAGIGVNNWGSMAVMDADEYTAFKREAYRAAGTWASEADDPKVFSGGELTNLGKMDTDWASEYFERKRLWHSHTVTIASGTEKTQYKISFNYKNEDSRFKNNFHNHFYLTTDLTHQVLPFLKVGVSNRAYYVHKTDKPDPWEGFVRMTPLASVKNEDGTYNKYPFGDPYIKSPYLNEDDAAYKDQTEEWKLFFRFFAEANILKNLTYNTNFAYAPSFSSRGYYYDNRSVSYTDDRNVAGTHNNRQADWVWNNVLNYKLNIKKHSLDLAGILEMQSRQNVNNSSSGKNQESPAYLWYNMGRLIDSKSLSTGFVKTQMLSYIGRAQYNYDDRYMASFSVRADGASQLSSGHKWAVFPSGALAWRISQEKFMKQYSWLTNLKLRASYGLTGNYAIAAYATAGSLYGVYANFKNDSGEVHYPGLEPTTRPTPNLEWEKNKMLDIGVDFGFWDGRIYGTFDWYDSKSFNLLYLKTLPYTSGFNQAWDNVGDTRNRGYELTVSGVPIRKKDFNLNVTFSFYKNKEELVSLQDPNMKEDINNGLFVGYPVNGVFYDYKQVGIWQTNEADVAALYGQKPGEVKVADLNGNGKVDADDRTILGTNRPDWVGGLQIGGQWKNLDFSVDLYGEFGAMAFDNWSTDKWAYEMGRWNTTKIDYWTPENPVNRHPRPVAGQSIKNLNATGYYDNDNIAIRNVTVGYTLPKQWLHKNIKKIRVYVTANNPYRYSQLQHNGGISWWESFYLFGVNIQL